MNTGLNGLNDYLRQGIHRVDGWCIPQLWQSLWPLRTAIGAGPVAEIGVFEGKFFIGLAKTFAANSFDSVAIDVFDMQQFNLDGAGVGKEEKLLENCVAHGVEKVILRKADSLTLRQKEATEITNQSGKVKFFSVDGCHEVLHTTRDIEFAMKVVADDGIISVDDYMNPNWPGVIESVAKMYLLREFQFVPLLFTCNKLLLCSVSYHRDYLRVTQDYIAANHKTTRMKRVKRFGFETLTVQPSLAHWEDLV
jgi:hypothetical protein